MDADQVAGLRLRRLGLLDHPAGSAEQAVRRLAVVQAQDYGPAGWSIAQRTSGLTQPAVDLALAQGRLVRTHVLRPTWHLVLPEDLRLLLRVTGPRVLAGSRPRWRQLGLDDDVLTRGQAVLRRALAGRRLTRPELGRVLADHGLPLDGSALGHLVMSAELAGLVCSAGLVGRQHGYALLDEQLPGADPHAGLDDDAALAALTLRFFGSHGPATAKDFQWWASLTLTQVRRGLELVGDRLRRDELDQLGGVACWLAPDAVPRPAGPSVFLLQGYDEYAVAYTQSKYVVDRTALLPELPGGRPVYNLMLVVDGRLAGHWKRTAHRDRVLVQVLLYAPLDGVHLRLLEQQVAEHARFAGLEPVLDLRVDPRLSDDFTTRAPVPGG